MKENNTIAGYMFSFVENDELVTKIIPKELKNKFIQKFEMRMKDVTSEEIEKFILENKVN